MSSDKEILAALRKKIEEKLDWGDSANWQTSDFENLHQRIMDETGVLLSVSTLLRIWGRVQYDHMPSGTTLNTLAVFAGYADWRTFVKQQPKQEEPGKVVVVDELKSPGFFARSWKKIAMIALIVVAIGLVSIYSFRKERGQVNDNDFTFGSKPLTRGLPNSVIFTYDAIASPTDSVYIQQSWDARRRTPVDKNLHVHTSVYYEPGFYTAGLVVGNKIVKKLPLLIPTNGWLGMIDNMPVPVYCKPGDFIFNDSLKLPVKSILDNNIPLQPKPPYIKYYNVGNFDPVPVSSFSFSANIKNEYRDGAAACQFSFVVLITDAAPIVIPLSVTGCVSEIYFRSIDSVLSGKNADLSGCGVDFSDWVQVGCKSTDHTIQYFINEKMILELPLPAKPVNIVGLSFDFHGTGAVKNIHLANKEKKVFDAF